MTNTLPPQLARALREEGLTAPTFVELPGGTFMMGSDQRADELPLRQVAVGPFAVAVMPVTNAEYAQFVSATGHEPPPFWDEERFTEPSCPVVGVSWFDAVDYLEWLSSVTGRVCRLPTEAEREYAARGGHEGVLYPWGDEPWRTGVHAEGSAGADRPHPVGSTPANGYGVYHLADNVHEWCSDWYARYETPSEADRDGTVRDPRGPSEGKRRASRGGSWRHAIKVSRIAARSSLSPDFRYNDYGMRPYADAR